MTDHTDLEISLHYANANTYRVELRFTDPQLIFTQNSTTYQLKPSPHHRHPRPARRR